jgi:mannose-6-phosphate isomerase-like protein (cupin superfamily)
MRYWLDANEVAARSDGPLEVRPLFGADRGCDVFTQRLIDLPAAATLERPAGDEDEVLYVLAGSGALVGPNGPVGLKPGAGAFVAAGTSSTLEAATTPMQLLSVLVHQPAPTSTDVAAVDLTQGSLGAATAGREFVLGATPDCGCLSATQFIGIIPPGRAPEHFHKYDEVVYVLDGDGVLEIGAEQAPLYAGASVHLPAKLVHVLANTGSAEMRVLGVFRPAGSPAEAYYPDGTAAVVPKEN